MSTQKKAARMAGVLYLLVIVFGVFAELYVRSILIVPENADQTVQNIVANKAMFRLGFISDLLMQFAFFVLPFPLFQLFEKVHRGYARLMVGSVMVSVAIMGLNMLHQFAAVLILEKPGLTAAFSPGQVNEMVLFFLTLQKYGYRIAQLFFGFWLFPLGYLVYRSGFMPKMIGVLLMIACFSFMVDFFLFFWVENYSPDLSAVVTFPTVIGEFAMCFWLLVKGVYNSRGEDTLRLSFRS
jgi:hypothetical protein